MNLNKSAGRIYKEIDQIYLADYMITSSFGFYNLNYKMETSNTVLYKQYNLFNRPFRFKPKKDILEELDKYLK